MNLEEDCARRGWLDPDYIGDGVYISHDGNSIILITHNGISMLDTIYLEPSVCRSFDNYRKCVKVCMPEEK